MCFLTNSNCYLCRYLGRYGKDNMTGLIRLWMKCSDCVVLGPGSCGKGKRVYWFKLKRNLGRIKQGSLCGANDMCSRVVYALLDMVIFAYTT